VLCGCVAPADQAGASPRLAAHGVWCDLVSPAGLQQPRRCHGACRACPRRGRHSQGAAAPQGADLPHLPSCRQSRRIQCNTQFRHKVPIDCWAGCELRLSHTTRPAQGAPSASAAAEGRRLLQATRKFVWQHTLVLRHTRSLVYKSALAQGWAPACGTPTCCSAPCAAGSRRCSGLLAGATLLPYTPC
jgi:hypothetical protein